MLRFFGLLSVTAPAVSRSEMTGPCTISACLKSPISANAGSRRDWLMRMRTPVGRRGRANRNRRLKPTVVHSSGRLFSGIGCAATHFDPSQVSKENDSMRWPRWSTASCSETTSNVTGAGSFSVSSAAVLPGAASHQVSRLPSRASDGGYAGLDESAVSVPPTARFFAKVSRMTRDDRLSDASWLSGMSPRYRARGSAARRRCGPPTGNTC